MPVLLTPDAGGKIVVPDQDAVFPLAHMIGFEAPNQARIRAIGPTIEPRERYLDLVRLSVKLSADIADEMVQTVFGAADEAKRVLYLDRARHFVEVITDLLLRLEASRVAGATTLWPPRSSFSLQRESDGRDFIRAAWPRGEPLFWAMLRFLAGAPDEIRFIAAESKPGRISESVRRVVRRAAMPMYPRGRVFGCKLNRLAPHLRAVLPRIQGVPDLIERRGEEVPDLRRAIAESFVRALAPLADQLGASVGGLRTVGEMFAHLMPSCLVEKAPENYAAYERFVRIAKPGAVLTAEGHTAANDFSLFMIAACLVDRRPVAVAQHGGLQGFDGLRPIYFTRDLTLPVTFISSGWTEVPKSFSGLPRRAKIVPLSDPYLSNLDEEVRVHGRQRAQRLLVVPIQKVRTFGEYLGQAVRDDNIEITRRATAEVLARCGARFDRVVVIYRTDTFEKDPLHRHLAVMDGLTVEAVHFREMPARRVLPEAAAVFWDTPSTGLLESLVSGIPTVTLLDSRRRGIDVDWAEQALIESKVGAYGAADAAAALIGFSETPAAWESALRILAPVLHCFGRTSSEWITEWREHLARETGGKAVGRIGGTQRPANYPARRRGLSS